MSVITPWALDALSGAPTYDARTLRLILTGVLGGSSQPLGAAAGVLSGMVVSASYPNVTVSPGLVVVNGSKGSYLTGLDAAASAALGARPGSARIDLVVFRVLDTSSARSAQIQVVAGTASATPVAPAVPADAIALAEVRVPSSGAVTVTRVAGDTAARGGIVAVADEEARWRVDMSAPRAVLQLDTKALWTFDGGTWWEVGAAPVYAYWRKNDTATVPNATWYTVTGWGNVSTSGVGYGTGMWTVSRAGRYLINASVAFVPVSSPAGQRVSRILVNGDPVAQSAQLAPTSTHNSVTQVSIARVLEAGDEISVQVYQSQGSSVALMDASPTCNHIEIERLGS